MTRPLRKPQGEGQVSGVLCSVRRGGGTDDGEIRSGEGGRVGQPGLEALTVPETMQGQLYTDNAQGWCLLNVGKHGDGTQNLITRGRFSTP